MANPNSYLAYWQRRQSEQQQYNQNLARQTRQNLQPIIDILVNEFKVTKIILFGSLVKGNFSQESDIDLAVEGIPTSDYFQVLAIINSMSDHWIDLKPLEALEPHFLKRVMETGECLYASDVSE